MKSLKKNFNNKNTLSQTKKHFASSVAIDPTKRDFDLAVIGGANAGGVIKYLQTKHFNGSICGFSSRSKLSYETLDMGLVTGDLPFYKYSAPKFNDLYDSKAARFSNDPVAKIKPETNQIITAKGETWTYKALVLNTGLDQKSSDVECLNRYYTGSPENRVFVTDTSDYLNLERNRRMFLLHRDHDFIVYIPKWPSKREAYDCNFFLSADFYLSKALFSQALNRNMKVRVITPNKSLLQFPFANEVVMDEINSRSMIECHFGYELTDITQVEKPNATMRYGHFKNVENGEDLRLPFGTLLATPTSKKRAMYEDSGLTNEDGLVTVNPYTLQHTKYSNIFAYGDCADTPTTKSLYASLNQSNIVKNNVLDYFNGNEFKAIYDGYSAYKVLYQIDRLWSFKHYYNNVPTGWNFWIPRFFGVFGYKFIQTGEVQYFKRVYSEKPNNGYPYIQKDKYYRPIEENKFVRDNGIRREDIYIHGENTLKLEVAASH